MKSFLQFLDEAIVDNMSDQDIIGLIQHRAKNPNVSQKPYANLAGYTSEQLFSKNGIFNHPRTRQLAKDNNLELPSNNTLITTHETRIKKLGGVEGITKQRKQGKSEHNIFGKNNMSTASYFDSTYKNHPSYHPPNKRQMIPIDNKTKQSIIDHHNQGLSFGENAKKHKVTRSGVAGIISRARRQGLIKINSKQRSNG